MLGLNLGLGLAFRNAVAVAESFLMKFTSESLTNVDGTRSLVNDGSSGVNADLFTGQGLAFEGSQYVNTDSPGLTSDYVYFFATVDTGGGGYSPQIASANNSSDFCVTTGKNNTTETNNLSVCYSAEYFLTGRYLTDGEICSVYVVVCKPTNQIKVYVSNSSGGLDLFTFDTTGRYIASIDIATIGKRNGTYPNYFSGMLNTVAFFDSGDELTASDIDLCYKNPEKMWYKDSSGDVQSDILSPATITDMQAGNGFIYLLNKYVTDGTNWYTKNLCFPESVPLVTNGDFSDGFTGWIDDDYWSLVNGRAYHAPSSNPYYLMHPISISDDISYIVEFDVEIISGGVRVALRRSPNTWITSIGVDLSVSGFYRFEFNGDSVADLIAWYRATGTAEFYIDNVKVYPASEDPYKVITGMSSDTLITNADQLPYGYQNALVNDDLTLTDGLLNWDGVSYGLIDSPLPDYCEIDFVYDMSPNLSSDNKKLFGSSEGADTNQWFYPTQYSGVGDQLHYKFGSVFSAFNTGATSNCVLSCTLDFSAGRIEWFVDGVSKKVSTGATATPIAQLYIAETYNGVGINTLDKPLGAFQMTDHVRTDAQRTTDVNRLMTKYGIV